MMLIKDLTHLVINDVDHYPWKKNKKEIGLMKDELGRRFMT